MPDSNPISFRLHADELCSLEEEAKLFGLKSANMAARKIVLDHLAGQKTSPVMTHLKQLHSELGEVRADLSVATEVLLAHGGNQSEAEARAWVRENLKSR